MQFPFLRIGLVAGAAFIAICFYLLLTQHGAEFRQKHRWVSWLLVWPVLIGTNKGAKGAYPFTAREWFGWVLVVVLIACGVLFLS